MSKLCKPGVIAAIAALAIIPAMPGNAATETQQALNQLLGTKKEFDGWWAFKTTISQVPVAPGSQGLLAEPPDLKLDGNTMLGRMVLLYGIQKDGGSLMGSYYDVRERSKSDDEDEEEEKGAAVSGFARNPAAPAGESTAEQSKPVDPNDPAAAAAAAAAELKKQERDVVMIVIVDIPDEDEDIVLRYRGTQLKTDMKGAVEFGKRNKDGKFEKAGDGTFVARKMN